MRRLLFQGWHRTKTLSRAQKLRAWAYRLEGVANAMTCVVFAGVMVLLWFSQRSLREARQDREETKTVESVEVWRARLDLPVSLKEEWDRQKKRVSSLEEQRRGFEMGVSVAIGLAVLGQVLGFMLARWSHARADHEEGIGPYAMEDPAKLLRPASHVDEPESE
jgi:hypothetical protein